jgi:hypothetical protein
LATETVVPIQYRSNIQNVENRGCLSEHWIAASVFLALLKMQPLLEGPHEHPDVQTDRLSIA